jgi:hypothetical protein
MILKKAALQVFTSHTKQLCRQTTHAQKTKFDSGYP